MAKVEYVIAFIDTSKHKTYKTDFVTVKFLYSKWSWRRFGFENIQKNVVYHTRNRDQFYNIHTGFIAEVDYKKLFKNSNDAKEFEGWLQGEFNYRIIQGDKQQEKNVLIEDLTGKIFKCKIKTQIEDIDGTKHIISANDCVTLVGTSFISNTIMIKPIHILVYNEKKIHTQYLMCDSFEMI